MFNTWRIFFSGRTLILAVFLAAALFAGRGVDRAHADGSTSGAPFAPADVFLAIPPYISYSPEARGTRGRTRRQRICRPHSTYTEISP